MSTRLREFLAIVWGKEADAVGQRIVLYAADLDEARKHLDERFGTDIISSLWNEEDANRPR